MTLAAINLNVFSNVASPDARHCLAGEAIKSHFACFDGARGALTTTVRVFLDPKPYRDNHAAWIAAILDNVGSIPVEIVETRGLINSFARSLEMSEHPYAMQLEHDFVFRRHLITHSLAQITDDMAQHRINYVRFNKRRNLLKGYDFFLDEVPGTRVPFCRVNGRSNNPQIIDLAYYKRVVLPLLASERGEEIGLEGGLCQLVGGGHVYGPLGWPATVQHLDGRRIRWWDGIARQLYLTRRGS